MPVLQLLPINLINTNALLTADQQLQDGSPAIDAGDNSHVTSMVDLACNVRIHNTTVDLGAFEFGAPNGTIKKISDNTFTVFPNPVLDELTLKSTDNSFKITRVILLNHIGKEVTQRVYPTEQEVQFDINDYPQGIYFLKIESEEGVALKKLIKK